MKTFLKRALIAAPLGLIWCVFLTPQTWMMGTIYSFLGAWLGSFIMVYLVLMLIGLFIKPKKPVVSEPKSKEDDLFE